MLGSLHDTLSTNKSKSSTTMEPQRGLSPDGIFQNTKLMVSPYLNLGEAKFNTFETGAKTFKWGEDGLLNKWC